MRFTAVDACTTPRLFPARVDRGAALKPVNAAKQGAETVSADPGQIRRGVQRRRLLTWAPAVLGGSVLAAPLEAEANILEDYTRAIMRPDLDFQQALVVLLDARGVLREIKIISATPQKSQERREANPRLPGMARRLRGVSEAAPVVVAAIAGKTKEESFSQRYGGKGDDQDVAVQMVDTAYATIGRVLTYTGRGIRPELMQSESPVVDFAIDALQGILSQVPSVQIEEAQAFRASR